MVTRIAQARLDVLIVMFAGFLSACDPCSGLVGCVGTLRIAIHGRLLDAEAATPAVNSNIDFIRTQGVALAADSVRATVDTEGLFQIEIEAMQAGEVVGDLVVRTPQGTEYRVPNVRTRASGRLGESLVLPPWSTTPHIHYVAEFYRRGHPRQVLSNVTVEVRRTGGVQVVGMTGDIFTGVTDNDGMLALFGGAVTPLNAGDLIADVTIREASGTALAVHTGVRFTASPVFRAPAQFRSFGAGPNLEYHLAVHDRGQFAMPVPDVLVRFERTGGIDIEPSSWEMRTDPFGRVVFPVRALESGVVRGTVTVVPAPPWKSYQMLGREFATYDTDGAVLYEVLGVGPGLPYYAVIRRDGQLVGGVRVDFRQTGGIPISPATFMSVSNDTGIVTFTPDPEIEGEVTADFTVHSPAPFAPFVVRGVRLVALDGDRPGGVLLGEWDVASPPASARSP